MQPAPPRTPERRHYMEKIVALLIAANRPMSPAELRDEIRKEIPTTTREALERAIWLELRKDKPRLARLGEGKYGLPEWRYRWITDGAVQNENYLPSRQSGESCTAWFTRGSRLIHFSSAATGVLKTMSSSSSGSAEQRISLRLDAFRNCSATAWSRN